MTNRMALMAIVVFALIQNASAQQIIVRGFGQNSCGAWTQARQEGGASAGAYMNWIGGYLTGFNAAAARLEHLNKYDVASAVADDNSLMIWVDNYCQTHPLEKLGRVAGILVGKLVAKEY